MRFVLYVIFTFTASLMAGKEIALQVMLPRGEEAPLHVYLAVDDETGACSRSFAFSKKMLDRKATQWLKPWKVTVETKAKDGLISGTVRAETGFEVRGKKEPKLVNHSWQISLEPSKATALVKSTDGEEVSRPLRVMVTPKISDDMMVSLWWGWGVPHYNGKKDFEGFTGRDHVRARASVYGVPVMVTPLRGKPEGHDGVYPGTLNLGALPASVLSPKGPMPFMNGSSYWRGRVVQSSLDIADNKLSGHVDADMRRGKKKIKFEKCKTMGVYRYNVDAVVIGDVVLGRYESKRTEEDKNFTNPKGVLFGYIGNPPIAEALALEPIASRPASAEKPTPVKTIFPGTKGITGQPGAYGPSRFWHTYLPQFSSSAPLKLQLKEIPKAVKYRADFHAKIGDGQTVDVSVTSDGPIVDTTEIWSQLPIGKLVTVTVHGLDGKGDDLPGAASQGQDDNAIVRDGVNTITFIKTNTFNGPYYESVLKRDDIRERLLAHCRWFRDSASVSPLNQGFIPGGMFAATAKNYGNRPVVGGGIASTMALLAALTDDPKEKAEAIAIGGAAANWMLDKTGGKYDLPDIYYKSLVWFTLYAGYGYLDLYKVSKDERWKEAALRLSRSYVKLQDKSGAWPMVNNSRGQIGVTTRRGWNGTDPIDAQWKLAGTADFLHWFGRVRAELETDQFKDTEDKAWEWVQEHSLKTFIWRRRGGYKGGQHTINNRLPSLLMLYMMDYAKKDSVDDATLQQLWDYCEATAVNWNRDTEGKKFLPHVTEYVAPRYTLTDPGATARYALISAKLYQRSKDPVQLAKADALAGSCYASQEATGLIHDWAKTHEPESIFDRFSDYQNTYPPHIAETGWMLWELHELTQAE